MRARVLATERVSYLFVGRLGTRRNRCCHVSRPLVTRRENIFKRADPAGGVTPPEGMRVNF